MNDAQSKNEVLLAAALTHAMRFMQIDTRYLVLSGINEDMRLLVTDEYIASVACIREGLELAKRVLV